MFTKQFSALFLIVSLILLSGCAKRMPDGMPKLYPVTVSITQEGKPFADCSVSLRYIDSSLGSWAIGGQSEADGSAKLFTNGYPGAPLGTFKVVLIKHANEGLKEYKESGSRDGGAAAGKTGVSIWSCVKEEYNDPAQTPLEVEITASTKTLSIDAGPAVQILQPFVP